jgi:hypothetical protein
VGLAYPGDALPAMTTFFANLTADANYRSIGERGRLYTDAATRGHHSILPLQYENHNRNEHEHNYTQTS